MQRDESELMSDNQNYRVLSIDCSKEIKSIRGVDDSVKTFAGSLFRERSIQSMSQKSK